MSEYYIHQNFINSLKLLSKSDFKSVKSMLSILKTGQLTPGMRLHPVGSFFSLSANMDIRIIVAKKRDEFTLIYVNHHDAAYQWAKQTRILETDINTTEIVNIKNAQELIDNNEDQYVPLPIQKLLSLSDEDKFLESILNMSPEWQEWLLKSFINKNNPLSAMPSSTSLVISLNDDKLLEKALSFDIPSWEVFLHPKQRQAIDCVNKKSIAITGGPGTGKTVILLNRVIEHAPKVGESSCMVLFTYSKSLADYLNRLLRNILKRNFFILPLYVLGGPKPQSANESLLFKMFNFSLQDGIIYLNYNQKRLFVQEILVDELQDAPIEIVKLLHNCIIYLNNNCIQNFTKITLATDVNQSIHRSTQKQVSELVDLCEEKICLTYSYRSTIQILQAGRQWFLLNGINVTENTTFGLSGPRVNLIECDNLSDQLYEVTIIISDLKKRYSTSEIAIIYCQYFNPSFKGFDRAEAKLKTDPNFHPYYHFASVTKGREFKAGIVFIAETFMSKSFGEQGNLLRMNTFFVALTRFRDEVTVIYTSNCVVRSIIEKITS